MVDKEVAFHKATFQLKPPERATEFSLAQLMAVMGFAGKQ